MVNGHGEAFFGGLSGFNVSVVLPIVDCSHDLARNREKVKQRIVLMYCT